MESTQSVDEISYIPFFHTKSLKPLKLCVLQLKPISNWAATFRGLGGHMQLWLLIRPHSSGHLKSACASPSLEHVPSVVFPASLPGPVSFLSSVHTPVLYTYYGQAGHTDGTTPPLPSPGPGSGPLHLCPLTVPLGCAQWNGGTNVVGEGER